MRSGIVETLFLHFMIGVGVAVFYVVQCANRRKERRLFRFEGDDPFGAGVKARWLQWFLFAYAFEFLTSFLMGRQLYLELSLSLIEAVAVTLGFFLVDRACRIFLETPPAAAPDPADEKPPGTDEPSVLREALRARRERQADERAKENAADEAARRERRDRFNRFTAGR